MTVMGRDGHWEDMKGHAIAATRKAQQGGLICPSGKGGDISPSMSTWSSLDRALPLLRKPPELHSDAEQLALWRLLASLGADGFPSSRVSPSVLKPWPIKGAT